MTQPQIIQFTLSLSEIWDTILGLKSAFSWAMAAGQDQRIVALREALLFPNTVTSVRIGPDPKPLGVRNPCVAQRYASLAQFSNATEIIDNGRPVQLYDDDHSHSRTTILRDDNHDVGGVCSRDGARERT